MWSFFLYFSIYLIALGVLLFAGLCAVVVFTTHPYPIVKKYEGEDEYWDPETKHSRKFASIGDPPTLHLSVVVPAYNEEERLPPMLDEAFEFLENKKKATPNYNYEIIVVSDGSKDGTVKVAQSYAQKYGSDKLKCLKLVKNRGKGGAVRLGVQRASGAVVLFADADGATKFEDFSKLETALKDHIGSDPTSDLRATSQNTVIVIGSRAHLEKDSLVTRSLFRTILMYGFHFVVWLFTVRNIRDTQCGFKLLTRRAAQICFENLHVDRWAFDVELLCIAQKLNIPIKEISVRWTEIEGSKLTPVWSWIQMGCDLGLIWLKYTLGAWRLKVSDTK